MAELSIIIPNWNGVRLLKVCLPSILNQSFQDFEVIIIDNGSTDESVKFIRKFFETKLIKLGENVGFAKAVNLGIINSTGKYIALINNDTRLDKNCLKFLIQAIKRKGVGMVQAKMLNFYKPDLIDCAGDYIDAVGHADNIGRGESEQNFQKGSYVFLISGGGALYRREVFDKVGLFDEDYFAYFEDVDLSFRAQLQGFKAYFEPQAKIYHIHKATSNKFKPLVEYLQFRNMTQTIVKCFPKSLLLNDFNWLKIILVNLNTIRFLANQGYLKQAVLAEVYVLFNIFRLLQKRKQIQVNIKVSKNYIIKNVRPKKVTFFSLLNPGI